jgi:hypothetical protein
VQRALEFYFYIGSTYTYLAVNRVEALAAQAGISVRWRPFNARGIMIEQNNRPFVGKPVKMSYMWRDIERRAARYGIPFKAIPTYPGDAKDLASRVVFVASLEGWCPAYVKETYRRWFLETRILVTYRIYGQSCLVWAGNRTRSSLKPTVRICGSSTMLIPTTPRGLAFSDHLPSCGDESCSGAMTVSRTLSTGPRRIRFDRRRTLL